MPKHVMESGTCLSGVLIAMPVWYVAVCIESGISPYIWECYYQEAMKEFSHVKPPTDQVNSTIYLRAQCAMMSGTDNGVRSEPSWVCLVHARGFSQHLVRILPSSSC